MASIFRIFPNSRPDSINRKIFRAAGIVAAFSILTRLAATLKELTIAHAFGRNDALDAFLIAFVLPTFLTSLLMSGLGSALLPTLMETRREHGPEAAQRLLSNIVFLSVIALVAAAILVGLFAPFYLPLLAHGFSPEKLLLTRNLLYLLLPWMVCSGLAILLSYILNAGEKFALPALVPLVTPLAMIGFIVFVGPRDGFSLALGMAAGGFLEVMVLLRILWAHDIHFRFRWSGFDAGVRKVLAQYTPMMASTFLMGSILVVDQFFAAMLPAGSVSALSYGNKISNALLLIGGSALSTATLPYFSHMAAEGDFHGCRHTIRRYVALITIVAVPVTLLVIGFSRPIVRMLFQRGAFTAADTQIVSLVQICYCLQIPFQALCVLFSRFICAVKRNDLLMYGSVLNLAVNIVMDMVLMRLWGVAGIAAATAIVSLVSLSFLAIASVKLLAQRAPGVTAAQAHAGQV
jgi:putative peptidoglycan lipid II flippase